jgi:hypothetical protein
MAANGISVNPDPFELRFSGTAFRRTNGGQSYHTDPMGRDRLVLHAIGKTIRRDLDGPGLG